LPTLRIVVRRPFIFLEDVTQVGLPRLDPSAHLDHHIERHCRTQNLLNLVLAGFDAFGDFDFLLPLKKLELSHLLKVEANGV
jgi:hypothetical protein